MNQEHKTMNTRVSRQAEEEYLENTLAIVRDNVGNYDRQVRQMDDDIQEMLEHYHDNDVEVLTILNNTITMRDHVKRALERNEKAQSKPYFGRIIFQDETSNREESLYIGRGGITKGTLQPIVIDWRAPVASVYYENGLGACSYSAPGGKFRIDLKRKRTYEIENGKLLDYFDSEVVANDDLLTKYLSKNKQAVLGEIVATIQKEQNEIIRKTPYHNIIVQGVAGSGKTTVAMHRISYILYNYAERFKPDDFYIVGSNRILLEYITGVLPDLDVYGIRQMTMEELFVRLLYEDWDATKYRIRKTDRSGNRGNIRGSSRWFMDLKAYCDKIEWNTITRESIFLNPKQFVEGFKDGKTGVFDTTEGKPAKPEDLIRLIDGDSVERYINENPTVSIQNKINMLNERLLNKVKDEFLGKNIHYTEAERRAILKAYRGRYGGKVWKRSIFNLYRDFLTEQIAKGNDVDLPSTEFDVYDLAALAYLYKRIKETDVISEAHHIVIDEAQDFGMMAYSILKFCIKNCTYTIMGDVSQNIHFGYGLNDWEELKQLLLTDKKDSFGILKKSYRNTVEISNFATRILHHGQFSTYPVEPIIRHGEPVKVLKYESRAKMMTEAADILKRCQKKGFDTIAVVCRDQKSADQAAKELRSYVDILESDLEKAVFEKGIMVLPVEYTKGLEFDTVLILNPDREEYPVDDGHAKLLYVAATRALHELYVLHTGNLTGLIADPLPERKKQTEPQKTQQKKSSSAPNQNGDFSATKPILETAPFDQSKKTSVTVEQLIPVSKSQTLAPLPQAADRETEKPAFGDTPAAEKLRPAGHSKIDLAVRWVTKQPDGLYIQSRYGILRLSPIHSNIIRITFSKGSKMIEGIHSGIAVNRTERFWLYKNTANGVELLTDDLCLRVDKSSGSISYMTRDKKMLLTERDRECRQFGTAPNGKPCVWHFLSWTKKERLYGFNTKEKEALDLTGTARYISGTDMEDGLPLVLSDKGYGILVAADGPSVCCSIPAYGPYLYTEGMEQLDFYFIAGRQQKTILNAYAYLCGKL